MSRRSCRACRRSTACLGAGGNDSFGIVEGLLASGYTMETMPPICTGADGDYIQWWREARDKYGYTATGLNAQPEIGAWASLLHDPDPDRRRQGAEGLVRPSVLTNNENLDSSRTSRASGSRCDTFTFEQIPEVFTRIDKLPG